MKNKLLFFSLLLCAGAGAQIRVTNGSLTLSGGTAIESDKLVLVPSGRFRITNNQILQSTEAALLNGTASGISQVITLGTPVVFSGTVRMYFDPAALNGNAIEDLKLSYKTDGVWRYASGSVVNTTDYYVEETVSNKTFEALTASAYYVTLPVSMISFSASRHAGDVVLLQWTTAAEANNSHFSIERSGDGRHFTPIGTVPAGGPGDYSFTDKQAPGGITYYRLRQHDRDGQAKLHGVRVVPAGEAGKPALYPNPAGSQGFTLDLKKTIVTPVHYTITNAGGQVLQTGRLANQREWIATGSLPAGTYLLQVSDGQSLRFQKQ